MMGWLGARVCRCSYRGGPCAVFACPACVVGALLLPHSMWFPRDREPEGLAPAGAPGSCLLSGTASPKQQGLAPVCPSGAGQTSYQSRQNLRKVLEQRALCAGTAEPTKWAQSWV